MGLISKFVGKVLPEVDTQLNHWLAWTEKIEDAELRWQAVASITHKKFHAQGGSVYALSPLADLENTVGFIVAFQTISDYLDNLCDRAGVADEAAFRQLHLSLDDAVDCTHETRDYYTLYPYTKDGSYLAGLVKKCREHMCNLPAYEKVIEPLKEYVNLYSDLQSLKHLAPDTREKRLITWADSHRHAFPGISPMEFSAATGSTLGIFILVAAASDPLLTYREAQEIGSVYFPWVCGLHILLDYYIDYEEDLRSGDLNFTYYYENNEQCKERLAFFFRLAYERCGVLRFPEFHRTIVRGLLAMYLSDPKALVSSHRSTSASLVKNGGMQTVFYHRLCRLLRGMGKL